MKRSPAKEAVGLRVLKEPQGRASTLKDWRARTSAATVVLPNTGGQGVLVPGGFVLTAAHCVNWNGEGGMALGDYCLQDVEPRKGRSFKLEVYAADPRADIAVLGEADPQEFVDDAAAFDKFRAQISPVPVRRRSIRAGTTVRVDVLTHHGMWIGATVARDRHAALDGALWLEAEHQIERGTSGGPVIDDDGRLLGLVSNMNEADPGASCDGSMPYVHLALPRWVWLRIDAAQRETQGVRT